MVTDGVSPESDSIAVSFHKASILGSAYDKRAVPAYMLCLSTLLSKSKIPKQLARGKPRLNLCACPFKNARVNYTEFIHSYK